MFISISLIFLIKACSCKASPPFYRFVKHDTTPQQDGNCTEFISDYESIKGQVSELQTELTNERNARLDTEKKLIEMVTNYQILEAQHKDLEYKIKSNLNDAEEQPTDENYFEYDVDGDEGTSNGNDEEFWKRVYEHNGDGLGNMEHEEDLEFPGIDMEARSFLSLLYNSQPSTVVINGSIANGTNTTTVILECEGLVSKMIKKAEAFHNQVKDFKLQIASALALSAFHLAQYTIALKQLEIAKIQALFCTNTYVVNIPAFPSNGTVPANGTAPGIVIPLPPPPLIVPAFPPAPILVPQPAGAPVAVPAPVPASDPAAPVPAPNPAAPVPAPNPAAPNPAAPVPAPNPAAPVPAPDPAAPNPAAPVPAPNPAAPAPAPNPAAPVPAPNPAAPVPAPNPAAPAPGPPQIPPAGR